MPRPQKHTVDYFPHDADASEGRTLSILFNNFGHEGISCWWQLLERVSRTNNHVISLRNGEDFEYLAAKLHFTSERLTEILGKMAELGAIDSNLFRHGLVWSQNFVNRLEQVYKTRKQDLPSKPTLLNKETELIAQETPLPIPENPQTKLKETKLKGTVIINNRELKKFPPHFIELRNKVFDGLKARRQTYTSRQPAAEAKAISQMLSEDFSVGQILQAYDIMKFQPFFQDKNLSMMQVRKDIHEVLKNGANQNRPKKVRQPGQYTEPDDLRLDIAGR